MADGSAFGASAQVIYRWTPATGWLLTSNGGRATSYFGLFSIAPLPVSLPSPVRGPPLRFASGGKPAAG